MDDKLIEDMIKQHQDAMSMATGKRPPVKLCGWIKVSDSHGMIGYEPIWLPEGEAPRVGDIIDAEKFKRAPWLDGLVQY